MVEFDEELYPQTVATPESIAIADEGRERLSRALETLPPRFREVLVLRELEGCSDKEITMDMRLTPSNELESVDSVGQVIHACRRYLS